MANTIRHLAVLLSQPSQPEAPQLQVPHLQSAGYLDSVANSDTRTERSLLHLKRDTYFRVRFTMLLRRSLRTSFPGCP